jgi:two-component system sensor histidine kinase DesK
VTSSYGATGTTDTVVPVARPEGSGGGVAVPAAQNDLRRRSRLGSLFAGIWLIYLVPVVQDALGRPLLVEQVLGVAGVVAFAAHYLVVFGALARLRRAGRMPTTAWALGVLGIAFGIFLVTVLAVGQSALGMFVFIGVLGVFVLPSRLGLLVAGALVVLEEALSRVVPGWTPVDGLWVSIALAAVAVWGINGMIERNIELALAQSTIANLAVQSERTRFARDLHDILGHSLTVLTVKAELAGRLVPIDPERAGREIAEVEQLARQALSDVRAAVSGYREVSLAAELASARAALEAAGIAAELPGAVDDIPSERRELLAWTIREGVTNVVRHSKAGHAWVRLDRNGVEVADDGVGPDAGTDRVADDHALRSHGLVGLRERAAVAGAALVVGRRDGGGFVLTVCW